MQSRLTRKALVVAGAFLIAILIASTAAWLAVGSLRTSVDYVARDVPSQLQASDRFSLYMVRANGDAQAYALDGGDEDLEEASEALADAAAQLALLEGYVAQEAVEQSAEAAEEVHVLVEQRRELHGQMQAIVAALAAGPSDRTALEEAEERLEELEQELQAVEAAAVALLQGELAETRDRVAGDLRSLLISLGALAALASALLLAGLILVQHIIVRPVSALSLAAGDVVAGDLERQVAVTSRDEIGTLQSAFNTMVASLGEQQRELQAQIIEANKARASAEQAQQLVAEQLATINRQHEQLREMEIPVIPVSETILVIPLIGTLDGERIAGLTERALHAVEQHQARLLVLDVTGTLVIDTAVARGLINVLQSVRLLGAEVFLVGIRPEVAQTIVQLGINFADMRTYSTLYGALQATRQQYALA